HWFHPPSTYGSQPSAYRLLPMRFSRLDRERYVATNLAGEFVVLPSQELRELVEGRLPSSGELFDDLVGKHFVLEDGTDVALDVLATKVRTRFAPIGAFTALHLFVVTLRCDHSCPYCQVSRVSSDRAAFDMSRSTANRAIDLVFQSPNPCIKVEFQGG